MVLICKFKKNNKSYKSEKKAKFYIYLNNSTVCQDKVSHNLLHICSPENLLLTPINSSVSANDSLRQHFVDIDNYANSVDEFIDNLYLFLEKNQA